MNPRKDSQKSTIQKLLRGIVAGSRIDLRNRYHLKGGARERDEVVVACTNHLAALAMSGRSREYNPATRQLVQDLRAIAGDWRAMAQTRLQAVERLMRLANVGNPPKHGEPVDALIAQLTDKQVTSAIDFNAIAEAAMSSK